MSPGWKMKGSGKEGIQKGRGMEKKTAG